MDRDEGDRVFSTCVRVDQNGHVVEENLKIDEQNVFIADGSFKIYIDFFTVKQFNFHTKCDKLTCREQRPR